MMRRLLLLLALPLAAAALSACGGGGGAASTTGGESAAALVPASTPIFLALNTDRSSSQIESGDAVLKKFPAREQVLGGIRSAIAGSGIDIDALSGAAGPEIDLAVLDVDRELTVGFTQPADEQAFERVLETRKPPLKHFTKDDWVVFSDQQAALDGVKDPAETLADARAYKDAIADLPDEAIAKAYTSGTGLRDALEVGGAGLVTGPLGGDRTKWASGAVFAHDDGIELQLRAKGRASGVNSYTATLTDAIPAGSVLALSFRDLSGVLDQLKTATLPIAAQVEQALGVTVEQLGTAVKGEGMLYVRPGTPIPEVTLVVKPKDAAQTASTVDRVVRHLAPAGSAPTSTTIAGVAVQRLDLGLVGIVYGVVDGRFVVSDSATAIRALKDGGGDKLADDKTFQAVRDAAAMPDATAGWLYVNVKDALPMLEAVAQLSGQQLPASVAENLRPLRSLLVYAAGNGDDTKVTAFAQTN